MISKESKMPPVPLSALHGSAIEVELEINRQICRLRGTGSYSQWPDVGGVLHIAVLDAAGEFSFVLEENQWTGNIQPAREQDGAYRVCLSRSTVSDN
jgi:hypothetical protein